MARMNIAEKRLPQDGRIRLTVRGREVDIRVSVIPMLHGEGVVMRLLDKSRNSLSLQAVRFPPELQQNWQKLIHRPHGLILVTGPTVPSAKSADPI
jgi:general secretion pathway protein E/type IV pilus assembly protein PilB